jgi:hypothetical protein
VPLRRWAGHSVRGGFGRPPRSSRPSTPAASSAIATTSRDARR